MVFLNEFGDYQTELNLSCPFSSFCSEASFFKLFLPEKSIVVPDLEPDYIIVGAGSAGCVMASRLSENSQNNVILLESGDTDTYHPTDILLHMPTALAFPMSLSRYNWKFFAEPEDTLGGRRITCPRGKGLGGSSSINGMVYVRGHEQDFETWKKLGADGWDYQNVLPFFKKAENWFLGGSKYRGSSGPLHVKFGENYTNTPLFEAFIKAGVEAGFPYTEDYNAANQEGVGKMAMTVFHSGKKVGERCSSSAAYLNPALSRPNLSVLVNSSVKKVIFEGKKAVGVKVVNELNGCSFILKAKKEIILCAGAIQTPQLLQVSGVGDEKDLEELNVDLIHHSPFVGKNLQDHLELYFQVECLKPVSLTPYVTSYLNKLRVGLDWIFFKRGLGISNQFEACAFLRSSSDLVYPDIQFHFIPVAVSYDGKSCPKTESGHSFQIHVGTCRSKSRGYVKAISKDYSVSPKIKFNYMSLKEDWEHMRAGIRLARQIVSQPALKDFVGKEISPGENLQSDSELDNYIREHVESAYHPCGTCRMGESPEAVTDSDGKVKGVENLRVVDASLFPSIPNGNLNAVVIMVAEKISSSMLQ